MAAESDSFFCNGNLISKNSRLGENSLLLNMSVGKKLPESAEKLLVILLDGFG